MYRRFISFIAAAAIAITALGAAPAYADDRDLAKALAAILGVAVIGKIIHDNNKKKREQVVSRNAPPPVYSAPRPRSRHHDRYDQPRPRHAYEQLRPRQTYEPPRPRQQVPHVQPRPLPRHVDSKLLPGQCFRSVDTRRGTYQVFGVSCLKQNYRHVNTLPQHCLIEFPGQSGRQTGFDARCLRDQGYSLARG